MRPISYQPGASLRKSHFCIEKSKTTALTGLMDLSIVLNRLLFISINRKAAH